MPKKSRFKYKTGQSVKFRYFDGSIHDGIIVKCNYRNEDTESLPTQWTMPVYTVHSPDTSGRYSRGYMSYPSITQNMIKNVLDTDIKIVPLKDSSDSFLTDDIKTSLVENYKKEGNWCSAKIIESNTTLEDAITKQKEFISGKVNN